MIASLILALCLQVQPDTTPAKPAPKPSVASARYQEELRKTAAKRKEAAQRKKVQRYNKALLDSVKKKAEQKEMERLRPLIMAEQEHQSQMMHRAASAQAWQAIGQASVMEAQTDRARFKLESQSAGAPQIVTPQGFVPYKFGIAPYSR